MGDLHTAADAFKEHQRRAHLHQPDLFPREQRIETIEGTWVEFGEYCAQVRSPPAAWDWKTSALKTLSHKHAVAHEWRIDEQPAPEVMQPGALMVRLAGTTFWSASLLGPDTYLPGERDAAFFYRSYTRGDLYDAIQWWLAEPAETDNPFVPLIRCYQLGVYPFSLAKDHVVLFAFRTAPAKLPTARLIR